MAKIAKAVDKSSRACELAHKSFKFGTPRATIITICAGEGEPLTPRELVVFDTALHELRNKKRACNDR